MSIFNHFSAAEYARKHALSPNPEYPPFPNDCTSFVSQAMLAGGWTMIGGSFLDRQDDTVWWWGKSMLSKASYTWGGAHNFSKFMTKSRRGKACSRDELDLGDVVQIARGSHVFHTMIVTLMATESTKKGPCLSYHTTNTLNKPLDQIEPAYPPNSGYSFLYWKILKTF